MFKDILLQDQLKKLFNKTGNWLFSYSCSKKVRVKNTDIYKKQDMSLNKAHIL